MWLWFAAAIAASLLLTAPNAVHQHVMKRRVQQIANELQPEFRAASSVSEVTRLLTTHAFVLWGPGPYHSTSPPETGISLHAERGLASGTLLWRPATARATVYFSASGAFRRAEFDVWPFAAPGFSSSRLDQTAAKYSGVVWMVALVLIAFVAVRREARRHGGLCIECAYDLRGTTSETCPECGAAGVAKPQRGDSTSAQGNALGRQQATGPKP